MRFSNKTCMYYIRLNTGENYPKTKTCHRTALSNKNVILLMKTNLMIDCRQ